ncbi:hypothetical protein H6CHR_03063 [Variovorax sp. PBL-H6]|nr:hypothetical protein H6CHR_03063 [Variovorax sp. PBL-H6]
MDEFFERRPGTYHLRLVLYWVVLLPGSQEGDDLFKLFWLIRQISRSCATHFRTTAKAATRSFNQAIGV